MVSDKLGAIHVTLKSTAPPVALFNIEGDIPRRCNIMTLYRAVAEVDSPWIPR